MEENATFTVEPIYGWGWVIPGAERTRDVPERFSIRLDDDDLDGWTGIVLTDAHEFEGCRVKLSQRYTEWDGTVNIEVISQSTDGKDSYGYGILDRLPSSRKTDR
jgi:hypothetical protein